jgi:adenine phosphoribosyltransferase
LEYTQNYAKITPCFSFNQYLSNTKPMDLKSYIRDFPHFPKQGIIFKDISPLLKAPEAMKYVADQFCQHFQNKKIDFVAGAESRGLIFASALASHLNKGLIMLRKKGKLPGETHCIEYELEYNTAALEVQKDLIKPGQSVLIVDDLLATGGTSRASAQLIEMLDCTIAGFAFVVELLSLRGRETIGNYEIKTLVTYD